LDCDAGWRNFTTFESLIPDTAEVYYQKVMSGTKNRHIYGKSVRARATVLVLHFCINGNAVGSSPHLVTHRIEQIPRLRRRANLAVPVHLAQRVRDGVDALRTPKASLKKMM
jgi:hypothetical protein